MNRKLTKSLFYPFFLIVFILIVYRTNRTNRLNNRALKQTCESEIKQWKFDVPVLLIDLDCLKNTVFNRSIRIGVDIKHHQKIDNLQFEISYFSNDSSKDFLDFELISPRRIIPKNFETRWIGNVEIPVDIQKFEGFWKRSQFLECRNMTIQRNLASRYLPPGPVSAGHLSVLRDELINFGMFPFFNGGSLLGWFRECTVIPHTSDLDFAVFAKDYNPKFLEKVENGDSSFKLRRKFGMVNDSFEMTFGPKKANFPIDLFLLYEGIENGKLTHHWVGGVDTDGTKYKYSYPPYDPWCSANLHGHIFWISCTPEEKIIGEYGKEWYLDHHTDNYHWNSSGRNVKKNGKWTKEQMKVVYNDFSQRKN